MVLDIKEAELKSIEPLGRNVIELESQRPSCGEVQKAGGWEGGGGLMRTFCTGADCRCKWCVTVGSG